MRQQILITLRLILFWIGLQFFLRLIFVLYEYWGGLSCGWRLSLEALWHGFAMDFSLIGYVFLLIFTLWTLLLLARYLRHRRELSFFTERRTILSVSTVLAVISIAIAIADLEIYRNWHSHVDLTPLLYIGNLGESLGSIPWYFTVGLLLFIVLLSSAVVFIHTRWIWKCALRPKLVVWYSPILTFVFALSMLIPIRGGFDVATMNVSRVAFSSNAFANHIAINATWNFMRELSEAQYSFTHYAPFLTDNEMEMRYETVQHTEPVFPHLLRCKRPNIIVLLMESQSAKFSQLLGRDSCTPHLDSVARTGILFSRMYAASTRSDKGVVATLAGYPAQGKKSIIKFVRKLEKLSFFPRILVDSGYHSTAFYYGGNAEFVNFRTCAYLAGFNRVVEQRDFPSALRGAKWGVHDEYVYPRLLAECDTAQVPFCKMYFTLSNHEPFDLPHHPVDSSLPEEQRMRRTARYADSCMNLFLQAARKRPWWDSTLVILLADHGHRYPGNSKNEDPLRYHIPMVWTGGALRNNFDTVIESTTSQTDLAAILLAQLAIPYDGFPFSHNTLAQKHTGAMVVYNHGFGWLTDSTGFIYDFDAERILWQSEGLADSVLRTGEAFFQKHHQHYIGL